MNQTKLINEVLGKYASFPLIQADMRKILKYAESANRLFLSQFTSKDSPTVASTATTDPADAELDAILNKFADRPGFEEAVSRLGVIILRSTAYREDHLDELRQILGSYQDDPEAQKGLKTAGTLITSAVSDAVSEAAK